MASIHECHSIYSIPFGNWLGTWGCNRQKCSVQHGLSRLDSPARTDIHPRWLFLLLLCSQPTVSRMLNVVRSQWDMRFMDGHPEGQTPQLAPGWSGLCLYKSLGLREWYWTVLGLHLIFDPLLKKKRKAQELHTCFTKLRRSNYNPMVILPGQTNVPSVEEDHRNKWWMLHCRVCLPGDS